MNVLFDPHELHLTSVSVMPFRELGGLPLPIGGEGGGEGVTGRSRDRNPSPASLREATSPYGRGDAEWTARRGRLS